MSEANEAPSDITPEVITAAASLIGLELTAEEQDLMPGRLARQRDSYNQYRARPLANSVPPALRFDPRLPGMRFDRRRRPFRPSLPPEVERPADLEEVAFWPVTQLARLVETRQVSSVELTRLALARLKRYDPALHCVVTTTDELALRQARRADREIAQGRYRGPLHGIPWGAKDILAVRGRPTTWGAEPYREQRFDYDATVVRRLARAGAVLVAKLTTGALAMGDVWFGGMTRNPWDLDEGSSGSSAGPGSAVAAGLVPFAIGSETLGSIVSPSTRNGVVGLRPTFGRVSRFGAMALSWSMDKLGPMARAVEDLALVFQAIHGPDGRDPTVVNLPFNWDAGLGLDYLRIGFVEAAFAEEREGKSYDDDSLALLRRLGARLVPIDLPDFPARAMSLVLMAEGAAAFDELTRSDQDDLLTRQTEDSWPNLFRAARFIPAVEYIQANRLRTEAMAAMAGVMETVDLYVAPSFSQSLHLTNLTGHPAVVVPNAFSEAGKPAGSLTFTGRLYDEARLLAAAKAYQDATDFQRRRPLLPG
jgi:Asp-tRNA(Asn)/Glu-tRNA(Gln) amidotransferase A subunit family amidase